MASDWGCTGIDEQRIGNEFRAESSPLYLAVGRLLLSPLSSSSMFASSCNFDVVVPAMCVAHKYFQNFSTYDRSIVLAPLLWVLIFQHPLHVDLRMIHPLRQHEVCIDLIAKAALKLPAYYPIPSLITRSFLHQTGNPADHPVRALSPSRFN